MFDRGDQTVLSSMPMSKKPGWFSTNWDEMRPHMIAGLFWYIVGLVSWEGITRTFDYLREHLGRVTATLIDIAAVAVIFAAISIIARIMASPEIQEETQILSVVQVNPETSTDPKITYKNKIRIALRNELSEPIEIESYWIANGRIALALPQRLEFQKEFERGSWRRNIWLQMETPSIRIEPKWTVRTWIGSINALSSEEFGRARENREFGTLVVRIVGRSEELHLPI